MERVKTAYLDFINRVPFYGRAILCLDSVNIRALLRMYANVLSLWSQSGPEFTARNLTVNGAHHSL